MRTKYSGTLAVILAVEVLCAVLMLYLMRTEPSEAELAVMAFAEENGISYREYSDSVIDLLERNPEAEEFVMNYPLRQEVDIDLSDVDRTRGVPLLMQWDERWGYMEYGSDMVAITGCGPVCLSMVGYYLTGDAKFYPDQVVRFAEENGYYSRGNGSKWTLISEGGKTLGLDVKELPLVESKIAAYLQAGDPIIAVMGPGDFTSSGHYIVLTAYEDGQLSVNDPNSYRNSEKTWSYETFADQVRNLWVIKTGAEE